MTSENWTKLAIEGEGAPGSRVIALLSGVGFRRAGTSTTTQGRVRADEVGLVLDYSNGQTGRLTAAYAQQLEFDIPQSRLGSVSCTGTRDDEELLGIVAKCPPWARASVARALLPERHSTWQRDKVAAAEKVKAERIAQLSRLGRVVSGLATAG